MVRDPRLARFGLKGFNKPKRTPRHKTKSHMVLAKVGTRTKLIRFGQQGVRTNQTPAQRRAFKARHAKNIARGRKSPAFWSNLVKWKPSKTRRK
jgi:hypothetical protein